jgi:hypothetical protein
MNEPLNTSAHVKKFTGKTHNHHALYYNQPLRLTPKQTQNPETVLDDFFQSYHLQDVRQIMWQWLTEVLSSPRDSANDPHERNNHIFFYEKIESLVEAAWIMRRGNNQQTSLENKAQVKHIRTHDTNEHKNDQPDRFLKPARLIEKATAQSAEVIAEVFDLTTLDELQMYLLPNWLRVAVINTESPYSDGNGRAILYEFYDQLLTFVEALFINSSTDRYLTLLYLNEEQASDPSGVITSFFQQCPIDYIRRELADFLEAGIGHDGPYPNGFSPWQAWMAYNHVLCLIEAAYQLYLSQQMQPLTQVLSKQMVDLEAMG